MAKTLRLFSPKKRAVTRKKEHRGSRHERGYDAEWDRRTVGYRKRNPICVECDRDDRVVTADVIDHKIPVALAPELRLDPRNWWSLCHECHNGFKRRMERFAIETGQVDKLILWCDDPGSRPQSFKGRPRKRNDLKMVV